MFFSRGRAIRALATILERNPDRDVEETAKECVDTILAMPLVISQRVIDLVLETYEPNGITQRRRDRMRDALEMAFNAAYKQVH